MISWWPLRLTYPLTEMCVCVCMDTWVYAGDTWAHILSRRLSVCSAPLAQHCRTFCSLCGRVACCHAPLQTHSRCLHTNMSNTNNNVQMFFSWHLTVLSNRHWWGMWAGLSLSSLCQNFLLFKLWLVPFGNESFSERVVHGCPHKDNDYGKEIEKKRGMFGKDFSQTHSLTLSSLICRLNSLESSGKLQFSKYLEDGCRDSFSFSCRGISEVSNWRQLIQPGPLVHWNLPCGVEGE